VNDYSKTGTYSILVDTARINT